MMEESTTISNLITSFQNQSNLMEDNTKCTENIINNIDSENNKNNLDNNTNLVPNNNENQARTEGDLTDEIKNEILSNIEKILPMSMVPSGQFPFYGCALCNISFIELPELDKHITSHQNRITSWDLRVQAYKKKKKLKKLKKLNIKEPIKEESIAKTEQEKSLEKIFKCAACFKQFSLSYYLKLHVRSHTGEKPYQCAQCGLAFITASKLGRHKKMHSVSKFECRICHKLFSRFDTLTKHFDKKHIEDRLEGEPYDYNEILPYLKDLQEEIIKDEEKECKEKNSQIKDEEEKPLKSEVKAEDLEGNLDQIKHEPNIENNIDSNNDDRDDFCDLGDSSFEQENQDEEKPLDDKVKSESVWDNEDYFPIDAWTTPCMDMQDQPDPDPNTEPLNVKVYRKKKKKSKVSNGDTNSIDQEEPIIYKCEICNKKIKTAAYVKVHMRTHTGEKPYLCYICNKGFISSSKLNRHILTHLENNDIKTELDGLDVKSETDSIDEQNENKKKKSKKSSKRKLLSNSNLKKILKKLPSNLKTPRKRNYACEFCNKKFLHVETLKVHSLYHQGETKSITCEFCLTEFDTKEILNEHLKSHIGATPYLCTICGKNYKKKETMIYHRRICGMEKKFQCDVCSKTFIAQCKLQRHLLSHRPDKFVVRYECPVCAHIFNTKYHIEMHLTTHEKDGLILKENRGEILAMVQQNARKILIQNDSSINTQSEVIPSNDERSRICNICGEIFNHFYYLEEHLKTHGTIITEDDVKKSKLEDAERRYKCKVCNKGFKLHYYLKLHNYTHTKEKPFICQQCGKGFITKGKLKRHIETHSGLKKYQCHICCKFFTRPSYLRIHVKTIHGVSKDSLYVFG